MTIEQAIYGTEGAGGYRFLACSPGFRDDWLAAAQRLCTGFGERPAGVACPACVFAKPFGPRHVAVVQVADQGIDDAGRPGALGFHLLIVPRTVYLDLGGDPFYLAEQFPPPWHARGELPGLEWTAGLPGPRTIEALRRVLDVPYSATLLGGTQALLDGGRLVFERTAPEPTLVRGLWALLPASTRGELWPATFTFGNGNDFDVAVVPRADDDDFAGYLHEEQAGDYPEGRYELGLQTAIESGDQARLDALLSRRSRSQTIRLALTLLAVLVLGPVAINLFIPSPPPNVPPAGIKAPAAPKLPRAEDCPPLPEWERAGLVERLRDFGGRLGAPPPQGTSDAALADALEALDSRLGPAEAGREPGKLRDLGPLQRQVRALLWKHGVADYDASGPNTIELMEKLEKKVNPGRDR